MASQAKPQTKPINLALQGGGAHGAFTWGVLDALLEDGRLTFEGISAASAGAMNAAVMAYGHNKGGAEKARELLEAFWSEISQAGAFYRPVSQAWMPHTWALDLQDSNAAMTSAFWQILSRYSPFNINPLNYNPIRGVLEKILDCDTLRHCKAPQLFITATNVRTGTPKIFTNKEMCIECLLASAALPYMFQPQEIDGEFYWDGGYMGNPSLWPLFYEARCRDILLVHVNPIVREEVPESGAEIENRLNEITFNAALLKELRAIDFVKKLLHEDMLKEHHKSRYKDILLHAIRTDDVMRGLSAASKFDTDWGFLCDLRDMGRAAAQDWLQKHFKNIGKSASVDIQRDYLNIS